MSGHKAKALRRSNQGRASVEQWKRGLAAVLMTGVLTPVTSWALPQGGTVAVGSATVSTPTATSMRVDQATQSLIMDWMRFNIASNESVRFQQPNAAAIALNRVSVNEPSAIYGSLSANGQIFLINPSGILFSSSSRVDVAALTATTLNITNQDFLSGNYRFTQDQASFNAAVVNQGVITAGQGGYVALLGAAVRNEGIIQANLGSVALASGKAATLDMRGDGLIGFVVTDAVSGSVSSPNGETLTSYVSNAGTLQADGGMVALTARAATDVIKSALNQTGIIEARSMVARNGKITLDGGNEGVVSVSGVMDASGLASGQTGGTIQVLGDKVGLFGASINASGDAGGGSVLVGGDFQGKGPVQNASRTFVSNDSSISADAVTYGHGGKVIVWSDEATRFQGVVSARGGVNGGDGGFVETSGKGFLEAQGRVDTSAPRGNPGNWLLDPTDLVVDIGFGFEDTSNLAAVDAFADPDLGAGQTKLDVEAINNAQTNVTLQASRDIQFLEPVSMFNSGFGITAQAGNFVSIFAPITTKGGSLNLTANASASGAPSGSGSIEIFAPLDTTGGGLGLSGGAVSFSIDGGTGKISLGAGITTRLADVTFAGPVELQPFSFVSISSGGGNIQFQKTVDGFLEDQFVFSSLSVDARDTVTSTAGDVTFADSVGSTQPLDSLTVAGKSISLQDVHTFFDVILSADQDVTLDGLVLSDFGFFGITIDAGGSITTGSSASLTATFGNVTLTAGQNVTLDAPVLSDFGVTIDAGGSITTGLGGSLVASGGFSEVTLTAGQDVTLNGPVEVSSAGFFNFFNFSSISITATSGSITTGLGGSLVASGGFSEVTLTAGQDVTLNGPVEASSSGDFGFSSISITATGGSITTGLGGSFVASGDFSDGRLTAGQDVNLSGSVLASGIFANVAIDAGGSIITGPSASLTAEGGDVTLTAGQDVTLSGPVLSDFGFLGITIESGNSITTGSSASLTATFSNVTLTAGQDVTLDGLVLSDFGFFGITIDAGGSITTGSSASLTATFSDVTLTAGQDVILNGLVLSDFGFFGITIDAGNSITTGSSASLTATFSDVTLTAGQDVTLNGLVLSGFGFFGITIDAGGSITTGPDASLTSNFGNVTLTAGLNLTLNEPAEAPFGQVSLDFGGVLTLPAGATLSNFFPADSFALRAPHDFTVAEALIFDGNLSLTAGDSLTTLVGASLTSNFGNVSLTAGLNLTLNEPAEAPFGQVSLDFGGVLTLPAGATLSNFFTADSFALRAPHDFTLAEALIFDGDLSLTAGDSLTTLAGASLTSNFGNVSLTAGLDLTLNEPVQAPFGQVSLDFGGVLTLPAGATLSNFFTADSFALRAPHDFTVAEALIFDGDLSLTAGDSLTSLAGASLTSNFGNVTLTAGLDLTLNEPAEAPFGQVSLNLGGALSLSPQAIISANSFSIHALQDFTLTQALTFDGDLSLTAGGSLTTLAGASLTSSFGNVTVTTGLDVTLNAPVESGGFTGVSISSGSVVSNADGSTSVVPGSLLTGTDGSLTAIFGDVVLSATKHVTLNAPLQAGGGISISAGSVALNRDGSIAGGRVVFGSLTTGIGGILTAEFGDVDLSATKDITLNGPVQAAGSIFATAGVDFSNPDFSSPTPDFSNTVLPGSLITGAGGSLMAEFGDVDLSATKDITLNGPVQAAGSIFVTAGSEIINADFETVDVVLGSITTGAGGSLTAEFGIVNLFATKDITLNGPVQALQASGFSGISVSAGFETFNADFSTKGVIPGSIVTGPEGSLTAEFGYVNLSATQDVTLNGPVLAAGSIFVTAGSPIFNSNFEIVDVALGSITTGTGGSLTSTGDFSSVDLSATQDVTLNGPVQASRSIFVNAGSPIFNSDFEIVDVALGSITTETGASLTATGDFSSVDLSATQDVTLNGPVRAEGTEFGGGSISVFADGGSITTGAAGSLTATGDFSSVDLSATQDVTLNVPVRATGTEFGGGSIFVSADGGSITTGAAGSLTATGDFSFVDLFAGTDVTLAAPVRAEGTEFGGGSIFVFADGGSITTGAAGSLTATGDFAFVGLFAGTDVTLAAPVLAEGFFGDVSIFAGGAITTGSTGSISAPGVEGGIFLLGSSIGTAITPLVLVGDVGFFLAEATDVINVKSASPSDINLFEAYAGNLDFRSSAIVVTSVGDVTLDSTGGRIFHIVDGTDIVGKNVNLFGQEIGQPGLEIQVMTPSPPPLCNGTPCSINGPFFVEVNKFFSDFVILLVLVQELIQEITAAQQAAISSIFIPLGPSELLSSGVLPENVFKSLGSEHIEIRGGMEGEGRKGPSGVTIVQ